MVGKRKMVNRPYGDLDPLDIEDEGVEVFHETGLTPRELQEQRSELLEALEPFAACADQIATDEDGEEWAKFRLLIKHYRAAAQALARAKGEKA